MADLTQDFIALAQKDADGAAELRDIDIEKYSELISFHAQQAAEKMLKAAILSTGEAHPYTHKLDELLDHLVRSTDLSLDEETRKAATSLTFGAVNARYELAHDITGSEALASIAQCNKIADVLETAGYDVVRVKTASEPSVESQ